MEPRYKEIFNKNKGFLKSVFQDETQDLVGNLGIPELRSPDLLIFLKAVKMTVFSISLLIFLHVQVLLQFIAQRMYAYIEEIIHCKRVNRTFSHFFQLCL